MQVVKPLDDFHLMCSIFHLILASILGLLRNDDILKIALTYPQSKNLELKNSEQVKQNATQTVNESVA